MNAVDRLLGLSFADIVVSKTIYGKITVHYQYAYIKDGGLLIGTFGDGGTFEEACENYLKKISGKTLVFDFPNHKKEVTVL